MSMYGASVSDLRAAAAQLAAEADQLDGAAGALTRDLGGLRWLGDVAMRFSDVWSSVHQQRMVVTAGFLRENSERLLRQAEEQDHASNSTSAPVPGSAVPPLRPAQPNRLESEEARRGVLNRADAMLKNSKYLDQFPDAMAEVRRWRDSFGDRTPSAAEAAQFERYLAAVYMANAQVRIVHDAAEFALAEFTEMAKAASDAIGEAALFGQGPEGVPGAILGFAGDLLGGAVDSNITDPTAGALNSMTADQLAGAAAGSMDAQLAAMAGNARSSDVTMHNNPFAVALTGYEASASQIEVARSTGDVADAFSILTGDGSVLDSALRNGMSAIPGLGQAVDGAMTVGAIAGASAQSNYHYQAGMMALEVALGGVSNFSHFANNVVDIG